MKSEKFTTYEIRENNAIRAANKMAAKTFQTHEKRCYPCAFGIKPFYTSQNCARVGIKENTAQVTKRLVFMRNEKKIVNLLFILSEKCGFFVFSESLIKVRATDY